MGQFYPLFVRRSDGKLETASKGRREINEPTKDQLDQTPDKNGVSDFYREIPLDETKHLDWRRKLGGMLAREMDVKEKASSGNGFILATFPEHYRLYEHVKRTEKDGKTEVKSKTHAAGGNDRQDAYLYGHPAGKRKRFRSPGDFFPHLLWLCTDETGDPNNCTCKLCSPDDLENAIPGAKGKVEKQDKVERTENEKVEKPIDWEKTKAQVVIPVLPIQQTNTSTKPAEQSVMPKPAMMPQVAATTQRTFKPLPPAVSNNQQLDRQYGSFMYRSGELVWFRRGQAWGLGVVLRRWRAAPHQYHYLVQPLSYPGHLQAPQHKISDSEMRPWLAWSVPKYTNENLNRLAFTYDNADWQGILNKRYGQGDAEVDASILAAKTIDSTYTLMDLFETVEIEPGVVERRFRAVYVGAEKIWLGDPVRLIGGSNTDVMVVHQILEQIRSAVPSRVTYLIGDVYRLMLSTSNDIDSPKTGHLPPRMNEDLAARNARSSAVNQTTKTWNAVALNVRIDVDQIKGRWYEATVLLPILLPQFEDMANKGEIPEASLWMNARGDCINANRPQELPRIPRQSVRTETRRHSLGRAVPPVTDIYEGLEPPNPPSRHANQGASDFMDLSHLEDNASGADGAHQQFGADPSHIPGSYY